MEDPTTQPEFLNRYIETLFADIDGKNKELVLLKTNLSLAAEKGESLLKELESLSVDSAEKTKSEALVSHELQIRKHDLNEAEVKVNQLTQSLNALRLDHERLTLNYDLVNKDNDELRRKIDIISNENQRYSVDNERLNKLISDVTRSTNEEITRLSQQLSEVTIVKQEWENCSLAIEALDETKPKRKSKLKNNASEISTQT